MADRAETFEEYLLKHKTEMEKKPKILPEMVSCYDNVINKYPDRIRISFDDGHTAIYEIRVEQPAPVIVQNIRIIRKWKQGYNNQPMRRRAKP